MKALIILLIASTFLSACKKENFETNLTGSWELRLVTGGMPPITYPPGNGNIIKFTETEYQIFNNGKLTKSGTYTIIADPDFEKSVCLQKAKGEFNNRIIYDSDTSEPKVFIHLNGGKLSFASGCFALDSGVKKEYEEQ